VSQLPSRTEVLVVGTGPVGLAVADSLLSHGHDVAVVDQQAAGANTSRAAVVHARTLELLEQILSKRLAELGTHAQFSIRTATASSSRSHGCFGRCGTGGLRLFAHVPAFRRGFAEQLSAIGAPADTNG
jgi:2-polyprenyl-6-methoxyphenol hydroxylase-like FAD-dependent oxidoreductase